ncbi:MAG: tetratricopeptide repeat protein [candidate division WOR-3 bacterium]|nr:MAG: tetratricopeptide repeat protein [candidate division WOR-3 bacterium]
MEKKERSMEQGEIEVLLEVGQTYLLNKEYDRAIKKFSEALRINPHDPELYYYLGLAYEGAERHQEAIEMYEKTLKLDKTFSNAEMRLYELQNKLKTKEPPAK